MNPQLSTFNSQPRRMLVRGVNWLGDAVMSTPALLRLREHFPEAYIAMLAPVKLRDLWMGHPAVNETIVIEAADSVVSVGRKLRVGNFDLALVLPNSPRAALEVWLARIPRRIGYARAWRNWFLTHSIPTRPGHARMRKRSVAEIKRLTNAAAANTHRASRTRTTTYHERSHQMHEYLHLAAALGVNPEPLAPSLVVTAEEVTAAKEKFCLDEISTPILGLNPGAEYGPAKRWPAERFIEAAALVRRRIPGCWLVFGGPAEMPLAEKVSTGIRYEIERPPTIVTRPDDRAVLNLAGRTSLRELMALLKTCRVLLTNDTGPMHVAAALGTPVVAPFGSTSPEFTGPGQPGDPRPRLLKSDAPCSPCFLRECPIDFRCMHGIGVERVAEAVLETLKH